MRNPSSCFDAACTSHRVVCLTSFKSLETAFDESIFASQTVRSDLWLANNPLTANTVLDYFAISHFYDRKCVNELAFEAGRPRTDSGCAEKNSPLSVSLARHTAPARLPARANACDVPR